MKCIVVGGGVIGTSAAWHLARDGHAVTLLERDRLGSGTTWHSAGNISWKPLPDDDQSVLYAYETIPRVEAESGQQTGWLRTGRTYIARTDETLHKFEHFDAEARARGIAARWLKHDEARALNPLIEPSAARGIWLCSLSGRLAPADLTAAYAAAARRTGAKIVENASILRLIRAGDRVTGVQTSDGVLEADRVVLAAGLWSRTLAASAGVALPQWPAQHFYTIVDAGMTLPRETPSFVSPDDLCYGREEVGHFLFGCFDEDALTVEPEDLPEPFVFTLFPPLWDKFAPYAERAADLFPILRTAGIRKFINGPETFTPDGRPLIGALPGVEGLIAASAFNSVGITWSAMAGALVSDIVAERQSRFPAERYLPGRFGERAADADFLRAGTSWIVSGNYRVMGAREA
ncbi:MAG: FAD-binding oxidoreductase [Proteobacteria bacterium]|nr:FAD-binding oxidoreductase [Pseudomonadota bacterium]